MIGLLLLVPIGSIATYLEARCFILFSEEKVNIISKEQAESQCFGFDSSYVFLLFCLLFFFWQQGLDKLAIVAYILS